MPKRLTLFCLTLVAGFFCLVACGFSGEKDRTDDSSTTQESKTEVSVQSILKKVKTANKKIESVALNMEVSLDSNNYIKNQNLQAHVAFKSAGQEDIQSIALILEETGSDGENYQENILAGDRQDSYYARSEKNGSWSQKPSNGDYDLDPNYLSFLEIIYSMEDDLVVEEKSNGYVLSLRSQNIDMISLFEDELNMSLTGVNQNLLNKELELIINKETFYLEEFKVGFDYSGQDGNIDAFLSGTFSDWNQVDDSMFEPPTDSHS